VGELPSHKGRSIELTTFRADATATISLGWKKYLPNLSFGTLAELNSAGVTVEQTLVFTASGEDRFALRATVQPNWIIDSIESQPSGSIADWQVEHDKKTSTDKLRIRLATALSKRHGPLRLKLSARCLESPLRKKLGLKDLSPVEFDEVSLDPENRFVAISTVDPYQVTYQGETFVNPVVLEEDRQNLLFPQILTGKLFRDDTQSAQLEISLKRQIPAYAATIEMVATLTDQKMVEGYRFCCKPEASRIDQLFVHFSNNEGKGEIHFLPKPVKPYFAQKPFDAITSEDQTYQTLSPKSFTAEKQTKKNSSPGANPSGEMWKITLKAPQSEPFEIHAIRVSNYKDLKDHRRAPRNGKPSKTKDAKSADGLPRTICPSLAAMREAVEHHASLSIETTDAMSVWIRNSRLTPVPITSTDPRRIEKRRATFQYESTDSMSSSRFSPIFLTVHRPTRNPLLVWQCIAQTAYGNNGTVKTTVNYKLENQGASRLRLLMPKTGPTLTIVDVALDGEYVEWVPEYASEKADTAPRLVAMNLDLPRTKRLPSVTINYSYDNSPLGISTRHRLVALKPDCEVISVDWRLLLPPGYESPDYIAMQEVPADTDQDTSVEDDSSDISPRQTFCWRTCLFGPLGRPEEMLPFNPLSPESWDSLFDDVESKALGSESKSGKPDKSTFFVKDYPDWNTYQFHASTFDYIPSVRAVHRNSLEVFRWSTFLVTLGLVLWPLTARWVRRLPVAIFAALAAVLLPPLSGCISSGILMGVLTGLLAVWLLNSGNGRAGARRHDTPQGPDSMYGTTARYAPATTDGSAVTQTMLCPRPIGENAEENEAPAQDKSNGTSVEVGKTIEESTSASETTPPKSPSKRAGGSTIIRHTNMLWMLLVLLGSLFIWSGSVRGDELKDELPGPEFFLERPDVSPVDFDGTSTSTSEKAATSSGTIARPWAILIPTNKKSASEKKPPQAADPMVYLPESFFQALEKLAHHQSIERDLWLLKALSLRAILDRSEVDEAIRPTFVFLTAEVSGFAETTEVQLPLNQKEVRLEENGALLDGQPIVPHWSEDGTSLSVSIAGRGDHQIELKLVPLPASQATRWNEKKEMDEAGFQITLPRFTSAKLELVHPANLSTLAIDGALQTKKKDSRTTQTVLSPEGHLTVWWSDKPISQSPQELPRIDELLLMDVASNAVTLQATWDFKPFNRNSAHAGNPRRFRDMTLAIDPQLRLLELTNGFTLQPIFEHPEKRRLRWTQPTEPPHQIHAKFTLEKSCGMGQFLAPALHLEPSRMARRWVAVRVTPNLDYKLHFPEADASPSKKIPTVTPKKFMTVWLQNRKGIASPQPEVGATAEDEPMPNFVIDDRRRQDWSFRTEPKSIEPKVMQQTMHISFSQTSASVYFEAEWSSGSCDTPEPSLRVPENFKIQSVHLLDDDIREKISWSRSEEGVIHLATGLLPPKLRTIQVEGTFKVPASARAIDLPVLSMVSELEVPIHVGIYRKPDANVKITAKQATHVSKPPQPVAEERQFGRPVRWLKVKPLDTKDTKVQVTPNRPFVRARQIVTVTDPSETDPDKPQEMVTVFELTPRRGLVDEIAIFVPQNVTGPFRTKPDIPLVRHYKDEKGTTLIFRPERAISKRQKFEISSPMEGEETLIPDVMLCSVDSLQRYIILPNRTKKGEYRSWQTRLLNRETRLKNLSSLMKLDSKTRVYRIMGRQWEATALTRKIVTPSPTVVLADIQIRWHEDNAYLGSASFGLKPLGNKTCRLLVPEMLTLLDVRIAGVPVSPIPVDPSKYKSMQAIANNLPPGLSCRLYEIPFTSKTELQPIEVLYRHSPHSVIKPPHGDAISKRFWAPLLDATIEKTQWTIQGPKNFDAVGDFEILEKDTVFSAILEKESQGITPLTPFLTRSASFGKLIRRTYNGLGEKCDMVWQSRDPHPTSGVTSAFLALLLTLIVILIPPIRDFLQTIFYRHWHLFGIALGLFWWSFLSPSVLGWVIILGFLVALYRVRRQPEESDSTVIRIG
jgi:hypothetical protein